MKKIISLMLAGIMTAICLCSCGSDNNELVMATNAEFPPYEY